MDKYMGIKDAASESGISEFALRQWCKQKKIRFNLAGNTKYILRLSWLEADLERMALEIINPSEKIIPTGRLRRVEI